MVDITRFSFHAMRFMESEWVQQMNASQVGQYVLLMCKAWLLGKDTTLPNNPGLLATWAKTTAVDQIVLDRFPLVETSHGLRRRNEALYREWLDANARIQYASENGKLGGSVTSEAKAEAARRNGMLGGRPPAEPKQNPTEPNLTRLDLTQLDSSKENGQGDWKNISIRFRRAFGRGIPNRQGDHSEYAAACKQWGEDTVLNMFEVWQAENQWLRDKKYSASGLRKFYAVIEELVDAQKSEPEPVDFAEARQQATEIINAQHEQMQTDLQERKEFEQAAMEKVDTWL